MIIRQVFHTYREDFPLIRVWSPHNRIRLPASFDLDDLIRELIMELSDLTDIPRFSYITRHTNDTLPNDHLSPFRKKFAKFVAKQGQTSTFSVPTVWFIAYCESSDTVSMIGEKFDERQIKYFEDNPEIYASTASIPPDGNYTTTNIEARTFPKFLHQVTQIGIDLLRYPNSIDRLTQLNSLEWMQGLTQSEIDSQISVLENHLQEKSQFYRENVCRTDTEKRRFWTNFRKVYEKDSTIFSWPHFLFNICRV